MSGDLVPRSAREVTDLADFEDAMLAFLGASGLPTDGVLVAVRERQAVFGSFGHALLVTSEDPPDVASIPIRQASQASVGARVGWLTTLERTLFPQAAYSDPQTRQ